MEKKDDSDLNLTSSVENSGITGISDEFKEEVCLSELYSLLQNSIEVVDHSPHQSLDTLTLLMERICSQQEALQVGNPLPDRQEFWSQLNATWLFVIENAFKSKELNLEDWKVVCETVVAVGDVLSLYGLVDYPLGFSETKIIEAICNGISEIQ